MSFRRTSSTPRGVRPAQVFKKRNNKANISIPNNSNATLLSEIVLRETGTIYSVKIGIGTNLTNGADGDVQELDLWCRCARAGASLPDFSIAVEADTINGFYIGTLSVTNHEGNPNAHITGEKFRFRRKCDENSLLQIIGVSTNIAGTGKSVETFVNTAVVIRVR